MYAKELELRKVESIINVNISLCVCVCVSVCMFICISCNMQSVCVCVPDNLKCPPLGSVHLVYWDKFSHWPITSITAHVS